jgi:hypothetical protein
VVTVVVVAVEVLPGVEPVVLVLLELPEPPEPLLEWLEWVDEVKVVLFAPSLTAANAATGIAVRTAARASALIAFFIVDILLSSKF